MKRRCEFTSYHFRQSEVRNDGQENNHTGRDEVTEGAVLQLWARWKRQDSGQYLEHLHELKAFLQNKELLQNTDLAIQKYSWNVNVERFYWQTHYHLSTSSTFNSDIKRVWIYLNLSSAILVFIYYYCIHILMLVILCAFVSFS